MTSDPIQILVVDDDPTLLAVLEAGLQTQAGYEVTATTLASEAAALIERRRFDLIVTDYALGDPVVNGLEILRLARRRGDRTLVIIVTAFASLEISIEAIHLGAYDFLTKPFQLDELMLVVRNAAQTVRLNRENEALRQRIGELIGSIDRIERQHAELLERIRQWDHEINQPPIGSAASAAAPGNAQILEMRRRHMRDQIASYLRIGETLREQLARERENIEGLFRQGLLSENVYRRALREGKLNLPEN
ncbi:MAG: response regulator [bacterium]|nr:response regulator [bacterium]